MEKYHLDDDIDVMCVTAESFPEGVMKAHQTLHSKVPADGGRRYFGISRPEGGGKIVYKAAAEVVDDGEAEKLGLEPFTIRSGDFISQTISDFMTDPPEIGRVFDRLLHQPGIDPNGYCLEMYVSETDVRCMVGLKPEE